MAKIRITKQFRFEMAHALKGHDGQCKFIHGHSYELFVTLIGIPRVEVGSPDNGMLVDFGQLKKLVREAIIDQFDHALVLSSDYEPAQLKQFPELFDKTIFVDFQPTCENLLLDFVNRIKDILPSSVALCSMKLQETITAYAEWFASDN